MPERIEGAGVMGHSKRVARFGMDLSHDVVFPEDVLPEGKHQTEIFGGLYT